MTVDEILEHHGVKGQKWGVRTKTSSGSKSSGKSIKDKFLDNLDIPGRPNRRSNTLTPEQLKKENSGITKAGKIATGAMLVAWGTLTLAAIKMGK